MIKQTFGILREPFFSSCDTLFPQQQEILNLISIHAHHGGFNLIYGEPGVGKTVIREHIEGFDTERENVVVSISRTMHTYNQIILQMAEAMKIEASKTKLEKALITAAYNVENGNKKLFVVIDEAHLLHTDVLRKLRLLLEHFPRRHTLVLFGQSGLLHTIALKHNLDLKTRVTYSSHLKPLNDETMQQYILSELEKSQLGAHVFDEAAQEVIIRAVDGNLRLCRNLSYYSLVEACRRDERQVTTTHVNAILIMPHWRSQEELLKQQIQS